jgi:hypothetical protein
MISASLTFSNASRRPFLSHQRAFWSQPNDSVIAQPDSVLSSSAGCVGFLRSTGARGFQAYAAAGQPLGLFQDKQAAIAAITAPNSIGD